MLRTYTGRCQCVAVRFEAGLDISQGTGKCNCTMCWRMRLWTARVGPEAFRLLAGEQELTDYQGNNRVAHHLFCRHCGIHPFERIDMPNMTGGPYLNINVACLDGVDIEELLAAPVTYYDGLHDNWAACPAEVNHL